MEKISFYGVILLNLIIAFRYCTLTIRKKINPSLAMWVFFAIAITGSLSSYLLDGAFSLWDNILNTSDILLCSSICIAIVFFGDSSSRFNRFDLFCLAGVSLILLFWFFSKAHFATNISLQLIQAIAYLPVINRMWKAGENTESFSTWILLFLVSALSLFTAHGTLAIIYSLRALICVSTLLFLMIRIEVKRSHMNKIKSYA
jgi:hypothetical protein